MDPESLQDVLQPSVFGEVFQAEVDSDLQTCPHVGWRAGHPSQLMFPDERVSELLVGLLELNTDETGRLTP